MLTHLLPSQFHITMAEIGTDIDHAAALLREGKLVGIPTETVYGLAGNALDEHSILKIFEVKRRPATVPLIAQTSSLEKAKGFVEHFSKEALLLAEKYWPGALTLVLEKSALIPDLMTSGGDTVGIRIPDHSMTLQLLSKLDFPLAVPSANIHGQKSPMTAEEVNEQIGDQIEYILDGGKCVVGFESTIVSFSDGLPVILRQGALSKENIESTINNTIN